MKNKIAITTIILLVVCLALAFVSCKETFDAPTNLAMSGNVLSWQAVEGAESYEIEVKKPYPDQYSETLDLVREQMRKGQLPEIVEDGPDFSEFTTILLGSPIWCGHASRPVMAFLEKYDLSGKVILPFATHGGGGISHYVEDIRTKYPQADIRSAFSSRGSSFSVEQIRDWLKENKTTAGVNIDADVKRYYPYNSLASQVIGFCGSDNQGLDGIEAIYEDELQGEKGRITKVTDANGGEIEGEGENYISAIDGNDLVLSIDATIQGIAEKYLKEACIDNKCTDGGNIVVMNPKTGDILAMAGYPNYNLNEPYETTIEELKPVWDGLSESEQIAEMQKVWRNKAVADTYEPGSTFKLITASAALEEGITTTDKEGEFCCTGGITVAGVRISCWRYYNPHGLESLRQALMNSCNPVFIGLGQEIGVSKYYDYLEKFGLLKRTGIDLPGEAGSIFLSEDKVGPVELATISFGQRFEITPIQMITAVSTIANKGTYVKPRIVKQIIDSQTGEVTDIPVEETKGVISKETAEGVLSMMGSVVAEGTGKNAQVQGYSIGGKTGTSEDGVNTGKYVTSFVGVAPVSEPEVVVLITLYNPTGEGGHQGGGVAAPIGSQVLGEILPYLEINQDNLTEEEIKKELEVPNVVGMTISEAKKTLEEVGLEISYEETEEDVSERIVTEQVPVSGIEIYEGTNVVIEYGEK